jgi:hypothetical protein
MQVCLEQQKYLGSIVCCANVTVLKNGQCCVQTVSFCETGSGRDCVNVTSRAVCGLRVVFV